MSGIFGFWNLDGRPADPALLAAMSTALAHRGPDGWDGWCQGPVGVGHRMFRTTPESRYEVQPLVSADGSRVLVADVRLDNREELLGRLCLGERVPGRWSDADLLLHAHTAWAQRCAERLLGAFAFVIWDEARREIVCGRDHFGEKPLFYFHAPGRVFAFASEIKALWALGEVPDDIDDLEVARHLMIPVCEDVGATYYRAVRKLLPGHTLTVLPSGLAERQYWVLDHTRSLVLSSDREYAEAVRDVFVEAVRCRLRTDGPVASMLSGGIDSSSVTCVASRLLADAGGTQPLATLSAVYPDVPASDERRYIEKVLEACDVRPSFFRADQVSPVADIDHLNWHCDGASKAGNLYLNLNLHETASACGARVVLDGFDGDSTLSHGDGWLTELALARRWWTLSREVKARAQMLGEPWPLALGSWIRAYAVAPALRRLPFQRLRRRRGSPEPSSTRSWAQGLAPEFSRTMSRHNTRPPTPRTEKEHHHRVMTRPMLGQSLSLIEAVGAASGVEVRFPFFDVRLVELCISLPAEQKLRRGWSRFAMRQAMVGFLPEEIRWRPGKSSVEPGFHHALRSRSGEHIRRVLSSADERLARYVDPAYGAELHRRFMAGSASPEESIRSWRITSLALWLMGSDRARTTHKARDWPSFAAVAHCGPSPQEV